MPQHPGFTIFVTAQTLATRADMLKRFMMRRVTRPMTSRQTAHRLGPPSSTPARTDPELWRGRQGVHGVARHRQQRRAPLRLDFSGDLAALLEMMKKYYGHTRRRTRETLKPTLHPLTRAMATMPDNFSIVAGRKTAACTYSTMEDSAMLTQTENNDLTRVGRGTRWEISCESLDTRVQIGGAAGGRQPDAG